MILVLLALLTIFSVYAGKRSGDTDLGVMPTPSSYSSRPNGIKGLYDTLDKLNYHVRRNIQPITSQPSSGVFFLLSANSMVPVSNQEWLTLKRWVEKGNLLIVAETGTDWGYDDGAKDSKSQPVCPSFLAPDVKAFRVSGKGRVDKKSWAFQSNDSTPLPLRRAASAHPKVQVVKARPLVPLLRDAKGTTAAFSRWGKGGVVVLHSAWPISNDGIGKDDNLILALNAVNYRQDYEGITVTFDEYHNGYGRAPGITSLIGGPAKIGLMQLFMAFILLVLAVSRRFGRPVYLSEGARQRSEYLSSMSSLLRKAHAVKVVNTELERKFLQDVAGSLGLPVNADREAILEVCTRRRPDKASELRQLIFVSDDRLDDNTLMALTIRRNHLRKELIKPR